MATASLVVGGVATAPAARAAEENGYVFNDAWTLVNAGSQATTNTQPGQRSRATDRATSSLPLRTGSVGVTATMTAAGDQVRGTNYIEGVSDQGIFSAASGMFAGNPTPRNLPGFGLLTNASSCGGPLGSAGHQNFEGACEIGTLTFDFDAPVTDPVIDVSGIGGWAGYYHTDGYVKGSFNSQVWRLMTPGVSMALAQGSNATNLNVERDRMRVNGVNSSGTCNARDKWRQGTTEESPNMEFAGCGTLQLRGTFQQVQFEIDGIVSPFSTWPRAQYNTGQYYTRNLGNAFADGVNGLNTVWDEAIRLPAIRGTVPRDSSQSDLSYVSVRMAQLGVLGDRVWLDADRNGLQDPGEEGVPDIVVALLDGDGNPVTDANGTSITTTTDGSGAYRFEQLPYGTYRVAFSNLPAGWSYTTQAAGNPDVSSAADPATGVTSPAMLSSVNPQDLDRDAGLVRPAPGFDLAKTSDPASGTDVDPGRTITYTITGSNTGDTVLDPVEITDDLARVLDRATMTTGPTATVDGQPATAPSQDGTALTWTGVLQPDQVVTITYTVTVADDAAGNTLTNSASARAVPPNDPEIVPPPVSTTHDVPTPGFDIHKASDPASGQAVSPGQDITYTITGTNTGATVLDPVEVTDDLTDVLANATITVAPTATIGGQPAAAPVLSGDTLTWNGVLQADQAVTIMYTVRVNAGTEGNTVRNTADGMGTAPGGAEIHPPQAGTTHPIPTPGFELTKDNRIEDGTSGDLFAAFSAAQAKPGDRLVYTLTGSNTGGTVLDPVTITDDLSDVFDNATLEEGSIQATIGGVPVNDPVLSGTTLTWTGALQPGQDVVITYAVVIHDDAEGEVLRNTAAGTAQPPGSDPIRDDATVETRIPASGFTFTKSSDPASGTTVAPGSEITYTLTGRNTGETTYYSTVDDDLSDVQAHAALVGAPTATIDDEPAGAPVVDGDHLGWEGDLSPGQTLVITYTVRVNDDAAGVELRNGATATAFPPGTAPPIEAPEQTTVHPVPAAGFTFAKSSDPESGTAVNPGDEITYRLVGENTGDATLDPVMIADDLAQVLAATTLTQGPTARIDGQDAADPTLDGTALTWTGTLAAGQQVVIEYTVRVDDDAAGASFVNHATATAQPPGSAPRIDAAPQETRHDVPRPGFSLAKGSDPASGASVDPGESITYAVTGTNTGETPLDVAVTDDLADVLDDAAVQGAPSATVDGEPAAAPVLDGTILSWTGTLQPGQVLVLTYSVVVDENAAGARLHNVVTSQADPPGTGPVLDDGPRETTHVVPVPGYDVAKSADPASGTERNPGDTITYTITGENTGETVLDPATLTDDMAQVLDKAGITIDPVATIDGEPANAPTVDGTTLNWRGVLQPGQIVSITYTVTLSDDATGGVENLASGTGLPPGGPLIETPEVQTFHPIPEPGFALGKQASPVSGATVAAGTEISYTLTGENTGETRLDPVTITDDLSAVLDSARLGADPVATVDGVAVTPPVVDGTTLTWTGPLEQGKSVVITYSVFVNDDVAGPATLRNSATGSAQPPGTGAPLEQGPVMTEHRVLPSSFTVAKSADPASGSSVDPGEEIEYTVTVTNTGETTLDPVTMTDDLSAVLDSATVSGTPSATVGGETVAPPVVDDTTLTWTGRLAPGAVGVITYTVRVNDDAAGATLRNRAAATAQPPGTAPVLTTDPQETTHTVPVPAFAFAKSSDPVSGSVVAPGDEITYTLTAENTGDTRLDPVTVTDDLSGVLGAATLAGAPEATIDGDPAAPPVVDGTTLSWSGALDAGQTATVIYTVRVHDDAAGATLRNLATATAQPPGTGPELTPGPQETTHSVPAAGYTFVKTSDPVSGTAVDPGGRITYTLTGTNTGETPLDPVEIVDDLSDVLDDATLTGDPVSSIGDAPTVDGAILSWSGVLQPGESVAITYTVTVHDDAAGATLRNGARSTAQPPGSAPPLTGDPQQTVHPVPVPGFDLSKTADPASGSTVNPSETITYTVTGTNTGATVLDPVQVTDDLSGVLSNATLTGDPVSSIGDAPTVDGAILSWTGALQPGESVAITYTVNVDEGAAGVTLRNVATATAQPPGTGPALETGPQETTHGVPVPGFALAKSSDPAPGSTVNPGATIVYTLTGSNTGETALDPVQIRDDLSGVLAHAAMTGEPTASIGGADAAAPTVDGTTLSWVGVLQPGEQVVITYTVTVDADAAGVTLRNSASGSATPPGAEAIPAPEVSTTHDVLSPAYTFEKSANPVSETTVEVGDTVTYTLTGVNTGDAPLEPVTITDDLSEVLSRAAMSGEPTATIDGNAADAPVLEGTTLSWSGALAPGQRVVVTYAVTVGDEATGQLENIASSQAQAPGGAVLDGGEQRTVHPIPGISLEKTGDLHGDGVAGDELTYTFVISNTGGTRLTDVRLQDPMPGLGEIAYAWPDPSAPGVLEVGEQAAATATYVLTQSDVDAGGVTNTATVSGMPPGGSAVSPVDAEDTAELPLAQETSIALEKSGALRGTGEAGGIVDFRFIVTNTGTVTLTDVTITDQLPGLSEIRYSWPTPSAPGMLAPGESATGTATYVLTAGDVARGEVRNAATATGTPPGDLDAPRAADDVTIPVGSLPATGVQISLGVIAAGLLALLGGLVLVTRRRRLGEASLDV
ncbi:DUF7927 domain-containing protein [Microbacterium resistens]|uniref:DUF7927 domain-containing protein n=1 Tax=Microbacterium resistens TaxID=156977 RepID=UPI00367309BE